jgi:hypothetical protein
MEIVINSQGGGQKRTLEILRLTHRRVQAQG